MSEQFPGRSRGIAGALLVLCSALLFAGLESWERIPLSPVPGENLPLGFALGMRQYVLEVAYRGLLHFGLLAVWGFLFSFLARGSAHGGGKKLAISLVILGWGLVLALWFFALGRWAPGVAAFSPALGYLFGLWIGYSWQRGWRARFWLIPKVCGLFLCGGFALAGMFFLVSDGAGWELEAPPLSDAERRELFERIESLHDPAQKTLRFSEREINSLIQTHGVGEGSPLGAIVFFEEDSFEVFASLRLRELLSSPRSLNIHSVGRLAVKDGHCHITLQELRVGRFTWPQACLADVSSQLSLALQGHAGFGQMLQTIESLRMESGAIAVTGGTSGESWTHLTGGKTDGNTDDKKEAEPNFPVAVRLHIEHILDFLQSRSRQPIPLEEIIQHSMQLAQTRLEHSDPLLENRAAVLAWATILGHPRLGRFLGIPLTEKQHQIARRRNRVTLQGRPDWTRHFCLSAALALLADDSISHSIGLFKEKWDAHGSGSGFSFADLLADRAGIRFAAALTQSQPSARRKIQQMAQGIDQQDLFPSAEGLPEGLSPTELEQYGGIDGPRYQRIIQEIERRLATCPLLQ